MHAVKMLLKMVTRPITQFVKYFGTWKQGKLAETLFENNCIEKPFFSPKTKKPSRYMFE